MPWQLQTSEKHKLDAKVRVPKPFGRTAGDVPDETDYDHRHFVNLVAVAFLLALAFCLAWTVKVFDEQRALERCIDLGRKDCLEVSVPPARSYRRLVQ